MEAIATLSLVCNVLAVVDFSAKVIEVCRKLKNDTTPEPHIASNAENLASMLSDLQANIDKFDTVRHESPTQKGPVAKDALQQQARDRLESIAKALLQDTDELKDLFATIMKKASGGGKLKRLIVAFKFKFQYEAKISTLDESIKKTQATLDTEFLTRICTTTEASTARSEQMYSTLTTTLQLFITRWSEGIRDISKLVASEAEATREHITLKTDDIKSHITNTIQSDIVDRETKEQREQILKTLWFPEMNARENMIEEASRETVNWILGESEIRNNFSYPEKPYRFVEWLQSNKPIFWLSGKPGSGKSTVMKFLAHDERICEFLKEEDTSVYIGGFFSIEICTNPLQKQIRGCLRTLLHQVFQLNPTILDDAMKNNRSLATKLSEHDWITTDLQRALFQAIESIDTICCFFIDGLDEMEPSQQQAMVEFISALGDLPNVKICVSSRPEPLFQKAFNSCPMLEVEDCSLPGIRRYVQGHLKSHQEILGPDGPDLMLLCDKIVKRSECVFLWVVLVVQSVLRGILNGDDEDTLIRRIERSPSDLHQLYQQILSQHNSDKVIYEEEGARLFWLLLLPFNKNFEFPLIFVLAATSRTAATELGTFWLQNELSMEKYISSNPKYKAWVFARTAGLLKITGHRHMVEFIHRSVREFLVNTNDGQAIISKDTNTKNEKWLMLLKGWVLWCCVSNSLNISNSTIYTREDFRRGLIRIATRGIISLQLSTTHEIELLSECKRLLQHPRWGPESDLGFLVQAAAFGNAAYFTHIQEDLYENLTEQAKNRLLYDICCNLPEDVMLYPCWFKNFSRRDAPDWLSLLPVQDETDAIWMRSVSIIRWLVQAGSDPHALFPNDEGTQLLGFSLQETAYLQFLYSAILEIGIFGWKSRDPRNRKEIIDSIKIVLEVFPRPVCCNKIQLIVYLVDWIAVTRLGQLSENLIPNRLASRIPLRQYVRREEERVFGFAIGAQWFLRFLGQYMHLGSKYDAQLSTHDDDDFHFLGIYNPITNPEWHPADEFDQECVKELEKVVGTRFLAKPPISEMQRNKFDIYIRRFLRRVNMSYR